MKTRFNNNIVIKLIENAASVVPGIKKVSVDEKEIDFDKNKISVDAWMKRNVLNVKSIASELQKTIYYNLSQQLDNFDIKIDIRVHI